LFRGKSSKKTFSFLLVNNFLKKFLRKSKIELAKKLQRTPTVSRRLEAAVIDGSADNENCAPRFKRFFK